jgi:predicted MFS family arabinose efflux permease
MTTLTATSAIPALGRHDRGQVPTLITSTLLCVFATMFLALCNFYLLLSTLPALVSSNGAGHSGAGLTTGALMAATVLAEIAVPNWVSRWGYRRLALVALWLLASPSLALCLSFNMSLAVLVSAVRGLGLGILFVTGSAIVAHVTAPSRRAEGLALYGAVSGLASIVGTPAGVWIAARGGAVALIVLSSLVAIGGLLTATRIPAGARDARTSDYMLSIQSARTLLLPAISFALTAVAAAIFMTFAPIGGVTSGSNGIAAALLVHTSFTVLARWASGRLASPPSFVLRAAGIVAGAGLLAVSFASHFAMFLVGAALTGIAFGIAQNVSLVWMFDRAEPAQYDSVSAIWSIAYDGGLGLGAAAFGFVLTTLGRQSAFMLTGLSLIVLAVGSNCKRR